MVVVELVVETLVARVEESVYGGQQVTAFHAHEVFALFDAALELRKFFAATNRASRLVPRTSVSHLGLARRCQKRRIHCDWCILRAVEEKIEVAKRGFAVVDRFGASGFVLRELGVDAEEVGAEGEAVTDERFGKAAVVLQEFRGVGVDGYGLIGA